MNMHAATNNVAIHETAATAAASQVKALVEARYTVAINRPRDWDLVREKLLKECRRPSFAEVARYNKPIGKGVVGPSIRFAEAAVRCMGNVVIDETTTYDDDDKRIIQVSVADLEANVPYTTSITIEKTVERRKAKPDDDVLRKRTNTYGDTVYVLRGTEDDILNKKNALLSKAIRTLALRLVPGDLVDECMELVVLTQQNRDATDPDAARRKLCDAFVALNVSTADLKAYVGADLDKLSPAEIADLRAVYSAIKEGETTWRAAFEAKHPEKPAAGRFTPDATAAKEAEKPPAKQEQKPLADVDMAALHKLAAEIAGSSEKAVKKILDDQMKKWSLDSIDDLAGAAPADRVQFAADLTKALDASKTGGRP